MKLKLAPQTTSALDGLTLQEVGDVMGITRERVRQVEITAVLKILKTLKHLGINKQDLI